ncbi:MAG: helix-turn-helix domain-containing protein [Blastocatellia bacterium]
MALKLKIDDIARKVGIKNASQLANHTGLGLTSSYQLWEGKAKMVSLRTLNTLCNKLKVGPGLLIDYTPDPDTAPVAKPAPKPKQRRSNAPNGF